jgi:Sel1 repeat
MYSEGHGVPKDLAEAAKWWRKAADQGNTSAQNHLAAQQVQTAQERGYKRITFEDFMLDGKDFAASGAKVSIQGVYVKQGEVEMLFPSLFALSMARDRLSTDGGIGMLTGDATRSLRKLVLDCRNNPVGATVGCSLTVLGYVSMCTRTTLVGSTNMPCLIVEDGTSAPPR